MKKSLTDTLNPVMGNMLQKVDEAIREPSKLTISLGLASLDTIKGDYYKFQTALQAKGELLEEQKRLDEYFHSIQRLKFYLTNSGINDFTVLDAGIYLSYLHKKHEYFKDIANNIDKRNEEA